MTRSRTTVRALLAVVHALMALVAVGAAGTTAAQPATAAAAASAPAAPPITYKTVAQALAGLQALDGNGTIVTHSEDDWVIVNEPLAKAQWSFTPQGHPAYPSVVRRIIQRGGAAGVSVQTDHLCEGSKDACTKMLAEFDTLNERIVQAHRARGRPVPRAQ